ncbi:Endoglucanase precursor [compost metagenome]
MIAGWGEQHGLRVILDLHKAPGQIYGYDPNPNPMLDIEENRQRYLGIWTMFAQRYKGIGDRLVFELLYEIYDSTGYQWNQHRMSIALEPQGYGRKVKTLRLLSVYR